MKHSGGQDKTNILYLNNLRILFACEIVLGHIGRYTDSVLYWAGKFMIVSVAFFFFISGYSIVASYHNKDNYLKGFLPRKIKHIVLISVEAYIISWFIDLLILRFTNLENLKFQSDSLASFVSQYFIDTNWFLFELVFFYVLFYLLYKCTYHKYTCFIYAGITIAITFILYFCNVEMAWYASAWSFPLGMIFYEFRKRLQQGRKLLGLSVVLCVVGCSCLFVREEGMVSLIILRNSLCIGAMIFLVSMCCLSMRFRYFLNFSGLRSLGKLATEIYLYQFVWLNIGERLYGNSVKNIWIFPIVILTAAVVHFLISKYIYRFANRLALIIK